MEKKVFKKKTLKSQSVKKDDFIACSTEPMKQNDKRGKKRKHNNEQKEEAGDNLTLAFHFSDNVNTEQIRTYLSANEILYKDMLLHNKKKVCYVELANKDMVAKTLELSGSDISGVSVLIHEAKHMPNGPYICKRMKVDAVSNDRRLILKNLPHNLSINELKKHFPTALTMKLPRELDNSKKFRSYGFLEFKDEVEAKRVYEQMQGLLINGCAIKLDKIVDKDQLEKPSDGDKVPSCLLVKQLSYIVTNEMLKSVFPDSKGIRIIHDPKTKKSKGFAFVEFNDAEDAQQALTTMHDKEFQGRRMNISFASKKKRRGTKQTSKPIDNSTQEEPEPME